MRHIWFSTKKPSAQNLMGDFLRARAKEFQAKQQPLIEVRNSIIKKYKFSRSEFEKRASIYRKPYAAYVGSMVSQRAADDAWVMFESYLFGKGKRITHSKAGEFLAIEGKTNATNIVFDRAAMTVSLGQGAIKSASRSSAAVRTPTATRKKPSAARSATAGSSAGHIRRAGGISSSWYWKVRRPSRPSL